jgi:hypothetical protein
MRRYYRGSHGCGGRRHRFGAATTDSDEACKKTKCENECDGSRAEDCKPSESIPAAVTPMTEAQSQPQKSENLDKLPSRI